MDGFSGLASAGVGARALQDTQLDALRDRSQHSSPKDAAQKFEALFATTLVKEMRKTLGDGFFGEGPQADVYAGWLDQFVGEAIARDGGLHLSGRLEQDLERAQAARDLAEQRAAASASSEPTPATNDTARASRTAPPTETQS